jgi:hypothetical protein
MAVPVRDLDVDQLRQLIAETVRHSMEDYLEDVEALRSKSFMLSIEEARKDYREGKVTSLEEFLEPFGVGQGDL